MTMPQVSATRSVAAGKPVAVSLLPTLLLTIPILPTLLLNTETTG
jgi:hypothetical protein